MIFNNNYFKSGIALFAFFMTGSVAHDIQDSLKKNVTQIFFFCEIWTSKWSKTSTYLAKSYLANDTFFAPGYFYNKAIQQNQEDERARIVDELEDAAYTNL